MRFEVDVNLAIPGTESRHRGQADIGVRHESESGFC